jgi:NADH/NAD ratio-sensing transcriptional regulator Rex
MLEQLKRLDIDRIQLDEALALTAFAKTLRAEYEQRNIEIPEWLDNRTRALNREIEIRRLDTLEQRLKTAKAQQAALKTPDEKRQRLTTEIQKLEAELAGTRGA